jgi:hypothetical protein
MNSEIVCQVLEVLEDLLLVSYRTNNKVFQGVLLDATRRLVVFQGVLLGENTFMWGFSIRFGWDATF